MITGLLAAAVFATLFVVTLYFKLRDHTSELYGRLREIEITNPEKDERLKDFQSWIRHENEKRQRLYNGLLSIFLCLTIVSLGSVSVISGYTSVLEKGQEVKFQRDSIACSPQAICKKLDDIEKKIQNSDSTKFASALDELWKKIDTLNASLHNVRAVSDDNTNLASGPP